MQSIPFTTANHALGAPPNWDEERDGPCATLYAERTPEGLFYSIWVPSEEELAILNAGGGIRLGIYNERHPVVNMHAVKLLYPTTGEDDAA